MSDESERRIEERSDCHLAAKIEWAGKTIACVVKDLSVTGARIEIAEANEVPAEFDLLLPAVPGHDQRFRVAVRWRSGHTVGGEFLVAA